MRETKRNTAVVGFCARSGTGKTTLLKQLIPALVARGLRVAVIKHAHHSFDTDQPGKDSYELRKAGARRTLVSSSERNALITEIAPNAPEPTLDDLIPRVDDGAVDLILVEGFKRAAFPKIELFRASLGGAPMHPDDANIIAFATDTPAAEQNATTTIPVLDLNDIPAFANFIATRVVTSSDAGE